MSASYRVFAMLLPDLYLRDGLGDVNVSFTYTCPIQYTTQPLLVSRSVTWVGSKLGPTFSRSSSRQLSSTDLL